jgi:hypothetical protein
MLAVIQNQSHCVRFQYSQRRFGTTRQHCWRVARAAAEQTVVPAALSHALALRSLSDA